MSDIFLSYSSKDEQRIGVLVEALEGLGWSVFWDHQVPPGLTWEEFIGEELAKAKCVVVAWSKAAVESDYVKEEARVGKGRRVLVPVLLEPVEPPFGYGGIHAADLSKWDASPKAPEFAILLVGLRRLLGRPPVEVEAQKRREAEEEARRQEKQLQEEGAAERQAQEEARKRTEEAERHQLTRAKKAEEEAMRKAEEAERRRLAEAEAARKRIEEEKRQRQAEEDDQRRTEEAKLRSEEHDRPRAEAKALAEQEELRRPIRPQTPTLSSFAQIKRRLAISAAVGVAAVVLVLLYWQLAGRNKPTFEEEPPISTTEDAAAMEAGRPTRAEDEQLNRRIRFEGGEFLMGSPEGVGGDPEYPRHRVRLSPFYIQEHEVTNDEYHRFDPDYEFEKGKERHPVVEVTWQMAMDYAEWLGGSLPTEAQWEYAARGEEGRTYPWGEEEPTLAHAQYESKDTVPVKSFEKGKTPEGVYDLAGNVWEWCRDWYGPYTEQVKEDPPGPATGKYRVLRGGSFVSFAGSLRGAFRNFFHPELRDLDIGFRVVWSAAGGLD